MLGEGTKVSSLFVIATEWSLTLTLEPSLWRKEEFSGKICRHYMFLLPSYSLHNAFPKGNSKNLVKN